MEIDAGLRGSHPQRSRGPRRSGGGGPRHHGGGEPRHQGGGDPRRQGGGEPRHQGGGGPRQGPQHPQRDGRRNFRGEGRDSGVQGRDGSRRPGRDDPSGRLGGPRNDLIRQGPRLRGPGPGLGPRRGRGPQRAAPLFLDLLRQLQQLTSVDPFERIRLETTPQNFSTRALDLIAPIGKGQRCLIVSPPKAGKTMLLLETANAVHQNHPEIQIFVLLVDERPEEVTNFRRSTNAEVLAASSDMTAVDHVRVAETALSKALEPVLAGKDVFLLLDSITRLARAYNTLTEGQGRTLSGGLDANTMQTPRQVFGSARKIEGGGSLTVMGTALIETGSRMDEVIFQEFKGTGNMELVLSRKLFEQRIFPCIDISKSGTRKEEKLYPPDVVARMYLLRRVLANLEPPAAMEGLLELLHRHPTNAELIASIHAGR